MRWVKASERLPGYKNKGKRYLCRIMWEDGVEIKELSFDGVCFLTPPFGGYPDNQIQWLDESPSDTITLTREQVEAIFEAGQLRVEKQEYIDNLFKTK